MATETVTGNEALISLPEEDIDINQEDINQEDININQENLTNENGETSESLPEDQIQNSVVSVPNTHSYYRPELILNLILTSAIANVPFVPRFARPREFAEVFFGRRGSRYQANRWQRLKKRIQSNASKIRNSKYCLYVLILLMALPISAIVIGFQNIMNCRTSTTVILLLCGIFGLSLITCRLATILIINVFTNLRGKEPTLVTTVIFFGLLTLHLSGMIIFYLLPPVFDPASVEYCDKDFYNYVHGMNVAVSYILVVAVLLRLPDYL